MLHALIADYHKTRKIQWTTEALKAYEDIKLQVSKCTIMYFMNDTAPITLHTDVSDYGVGGYLFQTVGGVNQPTSAQLRWSVIRKEAYGIYYSCMHLESLLIDRPFTIRTDHRNLLFIKQSSNRLIVRWYMALSEFTFNIEFVSSKDNGIADSMSRLCRDNKNIAKEYHQNDRHRKKIAKKYRQNDRALCVGIAFLSHNIKFYKK